MPFIHKIAAAGGAGEAPLLTLSLVASNTQNDDSTSIPSDAEVGDIAVLIATVASKNTVIGNLTDTNISGWTRHLYEAEDNLGNGSLVGAMGLYSRIIQAGDAGDSVQTMDGTNSGDLSNSIMLIFRQTIDGVAVPITSRTAAGTIEVTIGNPAAQAINTDSQTVPVIAIAAAASYRYGSTDWNDQVAAFTTESPAFGASIATSDDSLLVKYTLFSEGDTPVDFAVDKADQQDYNGLVSAYIKLVST